MEVSGHFDISSALPWVKKPWYSLDRSLDARRADMNILKKSEISYHCRNHTLDRTTLSLVQCFSTFVRLRPGKFFFYKTRARS